MKVSIVILNWKGKYEDCLEAVQSALDQDYPNKEILFVDNGSDDNTVSILKNKFPKLKYIELDKNYGVTGGRNKGANFCKGELIFFLENDGAWANTTTISEVVELFDKYEKLGVLYTAVSGYDSGIKDTPVDFVSEEDKKEEDVLISSSFRGGAAVIRNKLFSEIGGYPLDYFRQCEEKYFSLFTYEKGYFIGYLPRIVMRHKGSDYNGKKTLVSWFNCANDLNNIIRHYPGLDKYLIVLVKLALWTVRFSKNLNLKLLVKMYIHMIKEIIYSSKHLKVSRRTVCFIESLNCGLIHNVDLPNFAIPECNYSSPLTIKTYSFLKNLKIQGI